MKPNSNAGKETTANNPWDMTYYLICDFFAAIGVFATLAFVAGYFWIAF